MAKWQRHHQVAASFHYLTKVVRDDRDPSVKLDRPFSPEEFRRIVARIKNTDALDDTDENVILEIKLGNDLPFRYHEECDGNLHFGEYEGAYYGQEYRNNRLGVIPADSLNLRRFHYLVTLLRDGKILIGVTYNGQFGDYDGLRSCFQFLLRSNESVASRTIRNISDELGNGTPVEVKLTYRKAAERPERRSLFGRTGVIAIKASDFGEDFPESVANMARSAKGTTADRRRSISQLVNESGMLELDDDEIIGCSAIVRENGRQRTVYFIGENSFSTKYPLAVEVSNTGIANRGQVKDEMIRVMREKIIPLLAN